MRRKRTSLNLNMIFALILLVTANTIMGAVMAHLSRTAMKSLIHDRMLDISNTAAAMLDGDAMCQLTAEDKDSEEYQKAMDTLRIFQENIELEYIYAINVEPDGSFTFSVDPTVEDPGIFGEPVVSTKALQKASQGIPSVDNTPYEDAWGSFYSAYTPVFDSQNQIAVIVAVDFNADWYEQQISKNIITIVIIIAISLLSGILLSIFISDKSRQRFHQIDEEMMELKEGFKDLNRIMIKSSIEKLDTITDANHRTLLKTLASGETYGNPENEDEISELGNDLHTMQEELRRYIAFIYSQTYVDDLTGVGNKPAYQDTVKRLDMPEDNQFLPFTVAFFDINELKHINTVYGFEKGDETLQATANILKDVFYKDNVYRLASDEFIVILEGKTMQDMEQHFSDFDEDIRLYNEKHPNSPRLAVAKGCLERPAGSRLPYRQVFIKAEAAMRENKAEFYRARTAKNGTE
ncbi:MAG: GGDEF domain-containing protein [Oscillospiraceae bacterium]|nr:GGDEF domain-containing protein [Oscillospiraceae bacterium]